jgi:hypothetical protein
MKRGIWVEQERGTDEWTVTRYTGRGWSVLFRGDKADAEDYARGLADDARWMEGNSE